MDSRDRRADDTAGAERDTPERHAPGRQTGDPGPLSAGNAAVTHLLGGGAAPPGAASAALPEAPNSEVTRLLAGGVHRAAASPASLPPAFGDTVAASDGGRPLPDELRADAEASFGADFSDVRVHSDGPAASAAEQVSARAFTVGSDVYFGRGGYDPGGAGGRRLLAHELTHVSQQGTVTGPPGRVSRPGDAAEIAAERAATRFAAGDRAGSVQGAAPAVARQPDGGAPATTAVAAVDVDGVKMSTTPATARVQLREYAMSVGVDAARKMPGKLRSAQAVHSATHSDISGVTPELETATAMVEAYNAVIGAVEAEIGDWDKYLGKFAQWARTSAEAMLGFSEKRLLAERDRYGLTATETTSTTQTDFGPVDTTDTTYGMAANPQTAAMAGAAKQLAAALDPLQKAVHRLTLATPYEGPTVEFDIGNRPEPDPKELAAAQAEVEQVLGQYVALYRERVTAYPILGSYADFENLDEYAVKKARGRLEEVARGAAGGDQTAALVSGDLHKRLANIVTVRAALAGGDLNVWAADNLVARTKAEHGVEPGSIEDGVVNQQVARDASDRMWRDILIGALSFALGLIAVPLTGGTSLLAAGLGAAAATGGVVLTVGLAMEHLKDYRLASAAGATDFEKARSISSDDPSMIWLALDLIGVGLDVAAAIRAFARLAPLARQAVRAGEDAVKPLLTTLEAEAEQVKPGLGKPVRRAAEEQRGLPGGGGTQPTPPSAATGGETIADIAASGTHAEKSLDELRTLAKTDRDAAMALWQRYDDMTDSELAALAKKGDKDAKYFRQERIPPNDALEKILASDYRPPHRATATLREGTAVLWEKELRSGGPTAEQMKLNWRIRSLLTHTERKAVAEAPLKKGSRLYINGDYDPCRFCQAAMREAAQRTGAEIVYWWPGGRMIFP